MAAIDSSVSVGITMWTFPLQMYSLTHILSLFRQVAFQNFSTRGLMSKNG